MSITDHLSRLPLGVMPTPLHPLAHLSSALRGPQLFVKREDMSGIGAGGNKVRKLSFLLADAHAQGATVILTHGSSQSNHCALTACAAAMQGMRCELFLNGDDPGTRTGNLSIETLLDARLFFTGPSDAQNMEKQLAQRAEKLRQQGDVPYMIGLGGSNSLSVAGYTSAIEEVTQQITDGVLPNYMVVAAGSLGTLAGIILGTWVLELSCHVDGMSVLWPITQAKQILDVLLNDARKAYFPHVLPRTNYTLHDTYLGKGYGYPTQAGSEAASLVARTEGLLLDNTYTAKAMAGLITGCQQQRYRPGDRVLFWHTGGLGGFFAEVNGGKRVSLS